MALVFSCRSTSLARANLAGKAREDGLGLLLPINVLGSRQLGSLRCKECIVSPDLLPRTFSLLFQLMSHLLLLQHLPASLPLLLARLEVLLQLRLHHSKHGHLLGWTYNPSLFLTHVANGTHHSLHSFHNVSGIF